MSERQIRILIVDDAPDHARLWAILIGEQADMVVVGSLETADELVPEAQRLAADVVLLDLRMPGKPSLEALRELVAARPECRVIVCSGFDDPDVLDQCRAAGAAGHFTKSRSFTELVPLVRRLATGGPAD